MFTVMGIEKVDYKNKQGKHIVGTALHCVTEEPKFGGFAVERIYCGSAVDVSAVAVNCNIDVLYNKYGTVIRIDTIK